MLDDVEWYKVSCAIYNAKMPNGGSITDHVLYMIEMIGQTRMSFARAARQGCDFEFFALLLS